MRLVSRLPLDVAADARRLHSRHRTSIEDRVTGGAEITPADSHGISRATAVELTAINEPASGVEEKQIGCARGAKRFGNVLALVEQVREGVARLARLLAHALGTVLGKFLDIVRVDGDDREASRLAFAGEARELASNVPNERTVMTDESDEERRRVTDVIGRDEPIIEIRQSKYGQRRPERQHRRRSGSHDGVVGEKPQYTQTSSVPAAVVRADTEVKPSGE
jgi:hypothetical protein